MLDSFLLFVSVVIPPFYTLRTRLNTVPRLGGFFVIYFLPVLPWLASFTALGVVLSVYLLYEIGYMQNDVMAVRAEPNPTLRAPERIVSMIEAYFPCIILARLILFAVLTTFLYRSQPIVLGALFLIAYLILLLVFCLHNFLPSSRRRLTFFALNYLRYSILYISLLSPLSASLAAVDWLGLLFVSSIHPVFSVFQKYSSVRDALLASLAAFCVAFLCFMPLNDFGHLFARPLLVLTASSLALRFCFALIRPSDA